MSKKDRIRDFSWIGKISYHAPNEPVVFLLFFLLLIVLRGVTALLHLPMSLMIIPSYITLLLVPFYSRKVTFSLLVINFAIGFLTLTVIRSSQIDAVFMVESVVSLSVMTLFILLISEFLYHVVGYFKSINCELEISKRKAEVAAEAKTRFLANVSHEIRTPISGIMGITQMRMSLSHSREEKQQLQMVMDSSEKLLNIVNNVLDYSKIEHGELSFSLHTFSLTVLLKELFNEFSPMASTKNLELRFVDTDDVPEILFSDRYKLRTILTNLIQNAVSYTNEGSVVLTIKRLPGFGNSMELLFSVSDTGQGIDQMKLATILNAFEQGDSSLTKDQEGIGLGLAVSQKMIEGLGGTLEVDSQKGKGSTFSFILTTELIDESAIDPFSCETIQNQRGFKKVLLAEDNRVNQTYMKHFLEKNNYEVTIAQNGKEALEAFSQDSFSAILMDIQMPIMSGLDATISIRQIEKEKNLPHVPIIAVTASVTEEDIERYKFHGVNYFCPKPIDLPRLNSLLQDIVYSS